MACLLRSNKHMSNIFFLPAPPSGPIFHPAAPRQKHSIPAASRAHLALRARARSARLAASRRPADLELSCAVGGELKGRVQLQLPNGPGLVSWRLGKAPRGAKGREAAKQGRGVLRMSTCRVFGHAEGCYACGCRVFAHADLFGRPHSQEAPTTDARKRS